MSDIEAIAGDAVDVALRLHRTLGPGLLESVYETVLAAKLVALGYRVERQVPVSFAFEGMHFDGAFRIDILVESRLLIEVKSIERLNAAHAKQLLTYLRLTEQPLGLLINFGGATLKEGLRRIVNGHTSFASSREPNRQELLNVRPFRHDRARHRRQRRDRVGDRDGARGAGGAARGVGLERRQA